MKGCVNVLSTAALLEQLGCGTWITQQPGQDPEFGEGGIHRTL